MRNYKNELEKMINFYNELSETEKELNTIINDKKKQHNILLDNWRNSENKKDTHDQYVQDYKKLNIETVQNDYKKTSILIKSVKKCIIQLAYNITVENMYNNLDKLDQELIRYKKVQKILLNGLNEDFYITTHTHNLYYELMWCNDYMLRETIYYTEDHYNNGKFESYINKNVIESRQYSYYYQNIPNIEDLQKLSFEIEKDIKKCSDILNNAKREIYNIKDKYKNTMLYDQFEEKA